MADDRLPYVNLAARIMTAENTAGKQRGRPFKQGASGNPAGKPKGARHKATLAAEALLDGEAEALTRKAIDLAKAGDLLALRLCLERILPPRRTRPVAFDLTTIETAGDVLAALGTLAKAVSGGELTPDEGAAVGNMIEAHRRAIETVEIERRLAALEGRAKP